MNILRNHIVDLYTWLGKKILPFAMRLNKYRVHEAHQFDGSILRFVTCKIVKSGYHYTTQAYWCPACQGPLYHGPEGGGNVNLVCTGCRVDYGCLPGGYGRCPNEYFRDLTIDEVEAMLGEQAAFEAHLHRLNRYQA